jgi:3-vinyl bacteriochlorophyllide hydratase
MSGHARKDNHPHRLYTEAERRRRDESKWTIVQGILAPLQFIVFAVSVVLVWRYLALGTGAFAATLSVVIKTMVLYAIMVTGSLWERDVFGRYLFARPFFWEDVVSMLVIALHTAYLVTVFFGLLTVREQLYLALLAYITYVINAAQFVVKLRMARRDERASAARALAGAEG